MMDASNGSSSDIEVLASDRDSSDSSAEANRSPAPRLTDKTHNITAGCDPSSATVQRTVTKNDEKDRSSKPQQDAMCSSYGAISAESSSDDDVTELDNNSVQDDSVVSSSSDSPSQISPNHRIRYEDTLKSTSQVDSMLASSMLSSDVSEQSDKVMDTSSSSRMCASDTQRLLSPDSTDRGDVVDRPDSLSLPRPRQYYERQHRKTHRRDASNSSIGNVSQSSSTGECGIINARRKFCIHC